jgi:CO/xanthine dehydrogenase FAD-binding subunit
MRGDLSGHRVTRPKNLAEALGLLAQAERPHPIAGGTDLFVGLNDGKPRATWYLDLSTLSKSLRGITADRAGLRLGALTTYTDLRQSADVARVAPVLAAVARDVGALAIQNRGTIGGSLGNASPASDPAPVLMALDAHVELSSVTGVRTVALHDFFTGYRKTAARPEELITAVLLPKSSSAGWAIGYRKVGTRRAQAISKVVLSTAVLVGRGGRVEGARLCFGSVAATTVRARAAEAAILGEVLDAKSIVAAQEALARDMTPIDDVRSTAAYRMHVARNLLAAQLTAARGRKR